MNRFTLNELPRERCIRHGAEVLSLRECIAILLGTGTRDLNCLELAEKLVRSINPSSSESDETLFFEFFENSRGIPPSLPGIGPAKASKLQSTFEIARRYHSFKESRKNSPLIKSHQSIERALWKQIPRHLIRSSTEWIGFVPLKDSSSLSSFVLVEKGTRMQVNFDPSDLFRKILIERATGVYLLHFHPSGRADASDADIEVTQKIQKILVELQIYFYGHWIVTAGGLSLIRPKVYDIDFE